MSATVIPGAYPFHATAPDWVTLDESIDIVNGPPKKVVRVMQPEIKGGVLELRVSKADGTPLDATWRADGDAVSPAAAGHASKKLLPGSHEIHVFANGYASVAQNVAITLGQTTNLAVVMQPARVVMTTQKLEILDKVFFDTNKTTIKKISYPLLNEVARVLLDHPEIVMVRVEGHTDSRGSDVANLKLSDGRAKAVRAYLIKAGVAPDRLNAVGYGETKPVDPADNEAAWEKNRRVEFVIEQRKDQ
jgi:outer membrane protein OmpA-like peptidoglycan-associated protein